MTTRKDFLKASALAAAGGATGCSWLGLRRGPSYKFRTITYNVLVCGGFSREKGGEKPSREKFRELFAQHLGAFSPDLINFQESPGEAVVKEIAERLGMNWTFFHSGKSWPGALMTRYAIVESKNCPIVGGKRPEDLFTRHWGRAVIDAPFGRLIVHSAHLHPGDDEVRTREVTEVLKAMKPDFASGDSVILQGDLNHPPTKPMYKQWTDAGLIDTYAAAGEGPPETIPADKPAARIDYVWAYGPIARHIQSTRVLRERPFTTDPADPKSWCLSDHLPVLAVFG